MTVRMGNGRIKFREDAKLLHGRKFLLKMKRRIYQSCVTSVMLYGSETWRLRKNAVVQFYPFFSLTDLGGFTPLLRQFFTLHLAI